MSQTIFPAEEWAFLRAMLDVPEDRTTWLVYADWLDDRGDPRAEFLRLSVERDALTEGNPARAGIEARLAQLRAELDPQWMMVFDPAPVGNCSGCYWDDMRPTDLPDLRICHRCRQSVIYCHTLEEAVLYSDCDQRVALSTRIPAEEVTGEPAFCDPAEAFELGLDDDVLLGAQGPPGEEFLDAEPPGAPVIPPTLERPRPWWKFW
jgi:uncharacterized protein (TIGR02996 family)